MKIVTIVGARPQFVKAGTVSREIKKHSNIKEVIVHTGQHYDDNMSNIFFEEMGIPKPDYYLKIGSNSHGAMTGQMIEKIEEVVLKEQPEWILVYGDTNSTLAGAIVASKLHIKLAHVEAGLRSFNMKMPEEINRILTDRVSNILFCPSQTAVNNLLDEGYLNMNCKIELVGDVMYDGALYYEQYSKRPDVLINKDFNLCTIHRAENTDNKERLENIFNALNRIGIEDEIIMPLHPRTKVKVDEYGLSTQNIKIIDAVGYFEMLWLIKNSNKIITDSGGLQKEAFFFNKPCLTVRDETEWVELVEQNFNALVGTAEDKILDTFYNFKFNKDFEVNLYGQGNASSIIIHNLLNYHE